MAETYTGQIQNGVIVFDEGTPPLPEGARLRIEVVMEESPDVDPVQDGLTLYERLKPIIGSVKGLPSDFAEQHDHYIHGTPKR